VTSHYSHSTQHTPHSCARAALASPAATRLTISISRLSHSVRYSSLPLPAPHSPPDPQYLVLSTIIYTPTTQYAPSGVGVNSAGPTRHPSTQPRPPPPPLRRHDTPRRAGPITPRRPCLCHAHVGYDDHDVRRGIVWRHTKALARLALACGVVGLCARTRTRACFAAEYLHTYYPPPLLLHNHRHNYAQHTTRADGTSVCVCV